MANETELWKGASWKIAAFAFYAGLNGIVRYLSGGVSTELEQPLPVPVIVFILDAIALCIMLPWLFKWGVWQGPKVKPHRSLLGLHIFRVVTSAIAVISWNCSLIFMPLSEAVALSIIGPVLGIIGAKLYLKERVGFLRSIVLIICFAAVILLLQPGSVFLENKNNSLGLLCVFISALSFALAKISTRQLALKGESSQTLTAFLLLWIVPVSMIPALFMWQTPQVEHIPWLMFAGFLTALAIYAVTKALSKAEVTFLAVFDFFRFILDSLVGYFAFTEIPPLWAIWLFLGLICFSLSSVSLRRS